MVERDERGSFTLLTAMKLCFTNAPEKLELPVKAKTNRVEVSYPQNAEQKMSLHPKDLKEKHQNDGELLIGVSKNC